MLSDSLTHTRCLHKLGLHVGCGDRVNVGPVWCECTYVDGCIVSENSVGGIVSLWSPENCVHVFALCAQCRKQTCETTIMKYYGMGLYFSCVVCTWTRWFNWYTYLSHPSPQGWGFLATFKATYLRNIWLSVWINTGWEVNPLLRYPTDDLIIMLQGNWWNIRETSKNSHSLHFTDSKRDKILKLWPHCSNIDSLHELKSVHIPKECNFLYYNI